MVGGFIFAFVQSVLKMMVTRIVTVSIQTSVGSAKEALPVDTMIALWPAEVMLL